MVPLTVIIPTKNEEKNIYDCVKSVTWCSEIIVLDMGTDQTAEIAKKLGAKVIRYPVSSSDNFIAVQKYINETVKSARNNWILRLDADERVTEELKTEISRAIVNRNVAAYGIPRAQYFFDGFLTGGDWAYDRLIRLFKKGRARYSETSAVHEQFIVDGKIGYLKNKLLHFSHPDKSTLLRKFESYTNIEADNLRESVFGATAKMFFLPPYIFLRWMIWHHGYRDGLRGIKAGWYRAWYDFLLYKKYLKKRLKL